MSWLVRLYPRSWRERYGPELEVLVEQVPMRLGVALDLLVGAAIAYRDVVRANRVLSAAGAYLHGLCVAVLLQAIAFVTLVMVAQGRSASTDFRLGPVDLASYAPAIIYGRLPEFLESPALLPRVAQAWAPGVAALAILIVLLAAVMAAPRALRSLR